MNNKDIEYKNKVISKFYGYYKPTEPQNDLFSFEVYCSLKKCKKDYPDKEISTYYDDDIEDFSFADKPKYHLSWNLLMPVVAKIHELCEDIEGLYNSDEYTAILDTIPYANIDDSFKVVYEFIEFYNKFCK